MRQTQFIIQMAAPPTQTLYPTLSSLSLGRAGELIPSREVAGSFHHHALTSTQGYKTLLGWQGEDTAHRFTVRVILSNRYVGMISQT